LIHPSLEIEIGAVLANFDPLISFLFLRVCPNEDASFPFRGNILADYPPPYEFVAIYWEWDLARI
jgi:hypothetical protein